MDLPRSTEVAVSAPVPVWLRMFLDWARGHRARSGAARSGGGSQGAFKNMLNFFPKWLHSLWCGRLQLPSASWPPRHALALASLLLSPLSVFICRGSQSKAPQTGCLNDRNFVLPNSEDGSWLSRRHCFSLRPLSLACRWLSSPCVFKRLFLWICLCPNLFCLIRTFVRIDEGPAEDLILTELSL